ncbi:tryptophan--tRNA ligase [Ureaplasma ceti]|uniref:Tryptophan--tRNA ligase n=1 Tax=Ureaplasma ceti TaxID=3119530 RepID=A0ABP9UDI9_9BACT
MKRLVSGIQPTNDLTLGNYLGSIKEFIKYQDQYEMYIFVANLHSLTKGQTLDRDEFQANCRKIIRCYLAAGLDPEKVNIFYQSDILETGNLAHILLCNTTLGELNRMTQFKDKSSKAVKQGNGTEMIPSGLLTYPTLMAADILLYQAHIVPVGIDQKQHMELTRNIAMRMNNKYGEDLFVIPEVSIPKIGAKIMDLQDPSVKMSKSCVSPKGVIFLNENINDIIKKIKTAKTDSLNCVKFDVDNQPGVSNLMTIYAALSNLSFEEIEAKYVGCNYGDFKKDLITLVETFITDFQAKVNSYTDEEIDRIAQRGAANARKLAQETLHKIYNTMGIL